MKCHYDVLSIPRDADTDDIKKAYKKAAIKWHPDKNLDNTAEATEQFQLVQQAFEVLSDPHERKWYDDHREAILKGKSGGQFDDESLDVYQYFTASCYKGFGNDEKGFYSVYTEVFNKIAAEDSEYFTNEDSDFEIPSFGKSDSSFEEVHAFYAYWQSYTSKKSYAWLDPFDAREAPNRRVSRLIEKENKKVRDKAKKARNEEVRELVGFVRKRDKRVQAHAKHLQDVAAERAKKVEEQRRNKIKERNLEMASYKESEWSKFSNLEKELKDIEASLAVEFGESDSEKSSDEDRMSDLYCIACNKVFKTPKAFQNHESSKKHKENVQIMKETVLNDEENDKILDDEDLLSDRDNVSTYNILGDSDNDIPTNQNKEDDNASEVITEDMTEAGCRSKSPNICESDLELSKDSLGNCATSSENEIELKRMTKKQKRAKKMAKKELAKDSDESDVDLDTLGQSKKQRKKQKKSILSKEKVKNEPIEKDNENKDRATDISEMNNDKLEEDEVEMNVNIKQVPSSDNSDEEDNAMEQKLPGKKANLKKKTDMLCQVCKGTFPSKNKLFQHLEKTGHAIFIPKTSSTVNESLDTKKAKNKRKVKK